MLCRWLLRRDWYRRRLLLSDRPRCLGLLGSGQADDGQLSLRVAAGPALQAQDAADVRQLDPACSFRRVAYDDRWQVRWTGPFADAVKVYRVRTVWDRALTATSCCLRQGIATEVA
jgi:hypothetical protein